MKFYETQFDEYLESLNKINIHPELIPVINQLPDNIADMCNQIVYGPSGSGKYTQALKILEKYSPTRLKYNKKMTVQTDKQKYIYHISDIHYEVDMSLLGCNSKIIWHELYLQVVDIVSVCHTKQGIILCKNFHAIHNELLDIFYSYIQQYNHSNISIKIKFILLTDHISFIPNNILNSCNIIAVQKPTKSDILKMIQSKHTASASNIRNINHILDDIDTNSVLNLKEILSFSLIDDISKLPIDIFNTICNTIIKEMTNHHKMSITQFRDNIYDILVYHLDVNECIWYIMSHFICEHSLKPDIINDMTTKTFEFFKNYNNNYRPIYHLESILFYFIIKIYGYSSQTNDGPDGDGSSGNTHQFIER